MIHKLFFQSQPLTCSQKQLPPKTKNLRQRFIFNCLHLTFLCLMFLFQPIGLWHWGPWGWCAVTTKVTIQSIFSLHIPNMVEALSSLSGLTPDATSACDGQSSNVAFVASKLNMQLYLVLQGSQLIANVFRLLCPAHQQQSWFTKHRVTKTKSYTNLWNHAKSPQTGSYVPPRWTEGSLSRLLPKWVGYIGHDPWCWYAFKA